MLLTLCIITVGMHLQCCFSASSAGFITAAVIVVSRCFKINPDNVATPIAASLGDITSLALLSWIASMLYNANGKTHQNILLNTAVGTVDLYK